MRASSYILFLSICACSAVQSAAFLFEFICWLPLINLLCGSTNEDGPLVEFEGSPRWVETTSRYFLDWLFPPFTPSHVVCFVYDSEVTKKAYLMGGILGPKQVSVYDPTDRTWTRVKSAPIEFHHTQCIPVGGKIYIVSAFTGMYLLLYLQIAGVVSTDNLLSYVTTTTDQSRFCFH